MVIIYRADLFLLVLQGSHDSPGVWIGSKVMLTMDSVVKTCSMVSVRTWKKKAVVLWKELEINTVFPGFITALINTFCNLFYKQIPNGRRRPLQRKLGGDLDLRYQCYHVASFQRTGYTIHFFPVFRVFVVS